MGTTRFLVLTVGKGSDAWSQPPIDDWSRRLRRHGGVTEVAVRAEPFRGDVDAVRRAEGERLRAASRPAARLVTLDERGERLDTDGFTRLVDDGRQAGALAFALGGAYGHDPLTRDQSWRVVRLSDLVLNHEVARVVLYEQLYRAMTLIDGVPYHH